MPYSHPHIEQPTDSVDPKAHFMDRLREALPEPPLANAPTRLDSVGTSLRKARRKSKFTKEQDLLIVRLKQEGRTWQEIAHITGVGSYLAARNRYQVIVGQQGNNNLLSWMFDGRDLLQSLLDEAEREKWDHIAKNLSKATGKMFDARECQELARQMFWADPDLMGITEETIDELLKEKNITLRLLDPRENKKKSSDVSITQE